MSARDACVVLLGTSGGPIPVRGRAMTAQALLVGAAAYLVDCGAGTAARLTEAGIAPAALRALFVTHLHADHVADWFATIAAGKPFAPGQGFAAPLQVRGPAGTARLHAGVLDAFSYAVDAQLGPSPLGPGLRELVEVEEIALPPVGAAAAGPLAPPTEPFAVYEDERVRVTATLVEHPPAFPSLAFRFDADAGSVVFSGDTIPSANLVALARGAGLLVHEAMHARAMREHGVPERLVRVLAGTHTDVEQVGAVAAEAGVGRLVLSHLVPVDPRVPDPPPFDADDWLAPVRRDYDGPVTLGDDLMRLPLRG
jgi:ribonuclease BN (tRNA processing enzyme)